MPLTVKKSLNLCQYAICVELVTVSDWITSRRLQISTSLTQSQRVKRDSSSATGDESIVSVVAGIVVGLIVLGLLGIVYFRCHRRDRKDASGSSGEEGKQQQQRWDKPELDGIPYKARENDGNTSKGKEVEELDGSTPTQTVELEGSATSELDGKPKEFAGATSREAAHKLSGAVITPQAANELDTTSKPAKDVPWLQAQGELQAETALEFSIRHTSLNQRPVELDAGPSEPIEERENSIACTFPRTPGDEAVYLEHSIRSGKITTGRERTCIPEKATRLNKSNENVGLRHRREYTAEMTITTPTATASQKILPPTCLVSGSGCDWIEVTKSHPCCSGFHQDDLDVLTNCEACITQNVADADIKKVEYFILDAWGKVSQLCASATMSAAAPALPTAHHSESSRAEYSPPSLQASSPATITHEVKTSNTTAIIVGSTIGSVLGLVFLVVLGLVFLVILGFLYLRCRRRHQQLAVSSLPLAGEEGIDQGKQKQKVWDKPELDDLLEVEPGGQSKEAEIEVKEKCTAQVPPNQQPREVDAGLSPMENTNKTKRAVETQENSFRGV
ncbi:hypothetical protein QBC35DRAFT_471445 [Podospora australis]|uniref:Uncharacterized protein n=1 Tax=Podospora australis TaxID=1536484 RepID=A0AAN6WZ04_9PEZI|nr:hypothetical protein QBC35DRAFT_471445 [Podospora australis]